MVDLVTAYSKRHDLLYDLEEALRQLGKAQEDSSTEPQSVRSTGRIGHKHALQDRLSDEDRRKIVLSYEDGELRRDIAERYGISVSSVARVLRGYRRKS